MRVVVALLALVSPLAGCVSLSLQRTPRRDDGIEVSPPGEDGSRYIAVRAGRRTAPPTLKRKWATVATKACEGDYVLMSDGQSTQRAAGVVVARIHEGFVRCLMPAQAEAAEQVGEGATAGESAQAKVSRK